MNQEKRRQSSVQSETQNRIQSRRSTSAIISGKKHSYSAIQWGNSQLQVKLITNIDQCLAKKKVYVEIYSGPRQNDRNLSDCEDDILYALGATIVKKLSKHTHYLVWQYGLLSTVEKAKEWNIKIVNPMWVNECLTKKKELNFHDFPIMDLTVQEISDLQKKDRASLKRGKQVNQQFDEEDDKQLTEFKMRQLFSIFREQLVTLPTIIDLQSETNNKPNLITIEEETEPLYLQQISQQICQNKSKPNSKVQRSKQQNQSKSTIVFHKSCQGTIINVFESLPIKDEFFVVNQEDQKLKTDILIINEEKLRYDLLFCSVCLNKIAKIVSEKWILNSQECEQLDIQKYVLNFPLPKTILFPQNFYVYVAQQKTQQLKNSNSHLKSSIEQLIQHFGGKVMSELYPQITQKEYCDIILVMKIMKKTTAQQLWNQLPNVKIIHAEWLYQSIQNNSLVDLSEFIIS